MTANSLNSVPQIHHTKDYLGNIRNVLAKKDGVVQEVQHTAYYPFGGIIADLSSGRGVQNRFYNGKELDYANNLYWLDYGARQYDPTRGQFTTPDPLAEKYYNINPFAYCHNSPIMRIDPDGRDDYKVDRDGTIVFQQKTEDTFDRISSCNNSSICVEKGILQSKRTDEIYGRGANSIDNNEVSKYNVDIYQSENSLENLFEFVANNTEVEWCVITTSSSGVNNYYLTTSHSEGDDVGLSYVTEGLPKNESVKDATHSHSYDNGTVSAGDVKVAFKISQKHPNATFRIYDGIQYIKYNKDSDTNMLPLIEITNY